MKVAISRNIDENTEMFEIEQNDLDDLLKICANNKAQILIAFEENDVYGVPF